MNRAAGAPVFLPMRAAAYLGKLPPESCQR